MSMLRTIADHDAIVKQPDKQAQFELKQLEELHQQLSAEIETRTSPPPALKFAEPVRLR